MLNMIDKVAYLSFNLESTINRVFFRKRQFLGLKKNYSEFRQIITSSEIMLKTFNTLVAQYTHK